MSTIINEALSNSVYTFDLLPVVRVIEESIIRLDLDTAIDVLSELRERLEAEKESYELDLDLEEKLEFEHLEIPF
jgi:hypothetical protein